MRCEQTMRGKKSGEAGSFAGCCAPGERRGDELGDGGERSAVQELSLAALEGLQLPQEGTREAAQEQLRGSQIVVSQELTCLRALKCSRNRDPGLGAGKRSVLRECRFRNATTKRGRAFQARMKDQRTCSAVLSTSGSDGSVRNTATCVVCVWRGKKSESTTAQTLETVSLMRRLAPLPISLIGCHAHDRSKGAVES